MALQIAQRNTVPVAVAKKIELLMEEIWQWGIKMQLPEQKFIAGEITCVYGKIRADYISLVKHPYIMLQFSPLRDDMPFYFRMRYVGNTQTAITMLAAYMDFIQFIANRAAGSSIIKP